MVEKYVLLAPLFTYRPTGIGVIEIVLCLFRFPALPKFVCSELTRKQTVVDRGRTDRISLTHDLDLDLRL